LDFGFLCCALVVEVLVLVVLVFDVLVLVLVCELLGVLPPPHPATARATTPAASSLRMATLRAATSGVRCMGRSPGIAGRGPPPH
jgi:hypothetical protein